MIESDSDISIYLHAPKTRPCCNGNKSWIVGPVSDLPLVRFSWFLLISLPLLFDLLIVPQFKSASFIVILVLSLVLHSSVLLCFCLTSTSNPGILERRSIASEKELHKMIVAEIQASKLLSKKNVCPRCGIVRPVGNVTIHHCSVCQNCVSGFDHHCNFVGNCIGESNIAFFHAMLSSLSLYALFLFIVSLVSLLFFFQNDESFQWTGNTVRQVLGIVFTVIFFALVSSLRMSCSTLMRFPYVVLNRVLWMLAFLLISIGLLVDGWGTASFRLNSNWFGLVLVPLYFALLTIFAAFTLSL